MFLQRLEAITDSIRKQAFLISQHRCGGIGSDVDDWLQAEREVVLSPASELVDDEEEFRARIALRIRFCEFSGKTLFWRLELPAPIEVDKVSASLDKGILKVTAPKKIPLQTTARAV
jgi:hypothetical protein